MDFVTKLKRKFSIAVTPEEILQYITVQIRLQVFHQIYGIWIRKEFSLLCVRGFATILDQQDHAFCL